MSKFIFALGTINKNIFFPIFYMIVYTCIYIYYDYVMFNEATYFLEGIGCSLGQTLMIFISAKYKYRKAHKKRNSKKKNFLIILYYF